MPTADAPAPRDPPARLEALGLSSWRGDRLLFEGVDVDVGAGELLQVHGRNGAGKTTLLRILCGLTIAWEGEVLWKGRSIARRPQGLRRDLSYLGHADGIKYALSARENLEFAACLAGAPGVRGVSEALDRLGLARFAQHAARTLSSGQRRRVALARLLICRTSLWILDEPFTALDEQGAESMRGVLAEHLERGGVVVLTSHQPVPLDGVRHQRLELAA